MKRPAPARQNEHPALPFSQREEAVRSIFTYQHVIWDWNGTLFDDLWLCVDVMNGLLSAREMPLLTLERYREVFDFPVQNYYQRLGFDFLHESFEQVGTEFIRAYELRRLEAGLRAGAAQVVKRLGRAGVGQSVLSAYLQETLDELIAHFGLAPHFARLVGLRDHYARGKVENGVRWIRELGHASDEVLFVGDSRHDHEVAQAMGIDCVLVDGGHQSRSRLEACGVPVVDDLLALPGMASACILPKRAEETAT